MSERAPPEETTNDTLLGGALAVCQPARGYRVGLDALLLAAAAPVTATHNASTVVDLGAGVGTVGLAIAIRAVGSRVVLVERDTALVALARVNIAQNGLRERVRVVAADVTEPATAFAEHDLGSDSIDHAVANPPFYVDGEGVRAARAQRATSRAMPPGSLDGWIRAAARWVRPGGTLTLVHRVAALGELLAALDGRFGAVDVLPLAATAREPATRMLVSARKGSRGPLRLLAPLVTHDAHGGFTEEIGALVTEPRALQCFGRR